MRRLALYDEQALERQYQLQLRHNWDLEQNIDWSRGIDMSRPLVALGKQAFFFPGASAEERTIISQMMGLIVAASIFEMEETLLRLERECFEDVYKKFPISPEFNQLGQLFFEEERKHSMAFKRFVEMFAQNIGVDYATLMSCLPVLEKTKTEKILKAHLQTGGQSFWWLVAIIEQHFLLIFRHMSQAKDVLDPLYFELHQKHFEEEARHAPFPYLMLDLFQQKNKGVLGVIQTKYDLLLAQALQSLWTVNSLARTRQVARLEGVHPFFDNLAKIERKYGGVSFMKTLWKLFTETPYVSELINPNGHPDILKFAKSRGSASFPSPDMDVDDIVNY